MSQEFLDHLASTHFLVTLQEQMGGVGAHSCPSCSQYRSRHPVQLAVHYGARCKPFPVRRLYTDWLDTHKVTH